MKKIIRSYFLFFAEAPLGINFGILIIDILALSIFAIIAKKYGYDYHLSALVVIILLAAPIVNAILTTLVCNRYISTPRDGDKPSWYDVLVKNDGTRLVINGSIWAKGKVYAIERSMNYHIYRDSGLVTSFKLSGRYKSALVVIPITITMKFSESGISDSDKREMFAAILSNQPEADRLKPDLYIEDSFKRLNDQLQDKLDDLIRLYSFGEIAEPALLNGVIELIEFPDRIFSAVMDTQICLGSPSFSSCKGTSCGG